MTLLSIITIVRNDINALQKTYSSIQDQIFRDIEWIIVDGESTDGTRELADAVQLPFVKVITDQVHGLFPAMNLGLDAAVGIFVVFLNAGDTFVNQYTLKDIAPSLLRDDIDLLYGDSLVPYGGGAPIRKAARKPAWIKYGMFGCHQAMYYRRSIVADMRYNEHLTLAGDYDFTARVLQKTGRVLYVPFPLCIFDLSGISSRKSGLGRKENWLVQRKVLRMSYAQCIMIRLAYLAVAFVKFLMPDFYRLLRFRKTKKAW